jgi:hypothetical protein
MCQFSLKCKPERSSPSAHKPGCCFCCWASIHYQSLCQRQRERERARSKCYSMRERYRGWYLINIRAARARRGERAAISASIHQVKCGVTRIRLCLRHVNVWACHRHKRCATIIIRGDILGWIKSHTYRPQSQRVRALCSQVQPLIRTTANTNHP